MTTIGLHRLLAVCLLPVLLLLQAGCAPREGYGIRDTVGATPQVGLWRVSAATLYLAPEGPTARGTDFAIPDVQAMRADIRIEALAGRPMRIALRCEGDATLRSADARDLPVTANEPIQITLAPRGNDAPTLLWRPSTGICHATWGDGHRVTLRPESAVLPDLLAVMSGPLTCRAPVGLPLDPLQRVFLDDGALLQTCPVAPGDTALLGDPMDALNARIEALTGATVPREVLQSGNPDLPLDFSRAPQLDLIQLSYLHVRADYVGYLTARMLAYHAARGTQVRILVTGFLMLEKERIFFDSLAARYPSIQIQYYQWGSRGAAGPDDIVNQLHRVQHTRAFLALSPEPGRSRYIFGGRNLHDGFFFERPFDLRAWPYLNTYDEDAAQGIDFFSVYDDLEVVLRDDAAVRSVAAHHIAFWNRDAVSLEVGPPRPGRADRVRGMRHYLSLPWADGRDQIRWYAAAIDAAETEVLVVTPYLNPPPQIHDALLRARDRGVRVRMIVRLDSTDPIGFVITALNRRYARLYADLFEIEEYFPRPRMMHTKMLVIDERLAVTTSTNLDHRAFWHDTENGLIFMETPQVAALLGVVAAYRETSRRLTGDEPGSPLGTILYEWPWLRSVF